MATQRFFDTPKRVAIYCRVSTDRQDCERQRRELTEFADRAGWEVKAIFEETASGGNNHRPERKKAIALAQSRKIDAIVVSELSRWGRSTSDLIETLQQLQAKNVSLVCQSGMEFDLTTPQGKLMVTLLAGLAEFERDLIRERVKSGLALAKAKGKKLGRKPLTPSQLRNVKQLRTQGKSYTQIAQESGVSRTKVAEICKPSALE